jgi:hypothetical protein
MAREIKWTKGTSIYNPTLAATGQAYELIIGILNGQIQAKQGEIDALNTRITNTRRLITESEVRIAAYSADIDNLEYQRSQCNRNSCREDLTDVIVVRYNSRRDELANLESLKSLLKAFLEVDMPRLVLQLSEIKQRKATEESLNASEKLAQQTAVNSQILANKGIVPEAEIKKAEILALGKKEADLKLAQATQDKINAEISTTNRSKNFQRIIIVTVILLLIAGGAYYYLKGRKA